MKCVSCHATAETAERASFPEAQKCQVCHTTLDLPKNAKITPEKPIYVLPDFVFFSHAKHVVGCGACHGDDPGKPFLQMKMKACVDCHKTNKAVVTCNTCHDLSP
jgi:hypothetical protein